MASLWVTGVQKPVTVVWNYDFDERNILLLINGTWIKAIIKAVFTQTIQFVLTATLLLPVQYTLICCCGAQLPQPALLHNRIIYLFSETPSCQMGNELIQGLHLQQHINPWRASLGHGQTWPHRWANGGKPLRSDVPLWAKQPFIKMSSACVCLELFISYSLLEEEMRQVSF